MNYIESFPYLIVATAISGIYFEWPALIAIWLAFLGRILFAIAYSFSPNKRVLAAPLIVLPTLMMIFLAIASSIMLLTG
eukprot:CAMPEP_0168610590 /NCGR_PEP_ID=MMETSP0449_2-20121227/1872_1 /TAXON_ID=1082188 /ORGANISM="Strombidium rassoulzadegani, Strain ras09" /LENGTH=78 /DNA_ID=CAMNT_0008650913 /DNA_START=262 /DNA_END=498 /DNA_ORIENTATION=-